MSVPYFTRLKFAFRTFFSVLDYGRVPDDVARALGAAAPAPAPDSAAPPTADAAAPSATSREPEPVGATQLLALLQRDGRLVDFLMEDISPYPDAQIGAAVRDVHASTREALLRYVSLAPVLDSDEGSSVTVGAGTDAAAVKVVGNLAGQPPYRGVLRHRGWQVSRLELPPLSPAGRTIVAPAEVEVP